MFFSSMQAILTIPVCAVLVKKKKVMSYLNLRIWERSPKYLSTRSHVFSWPYAINKGLQRGFKNNGFLKRPFIRVLRMAPKTNFVH